MTHPGALDAREAIVVRVEKAEKPLEELCRFDRFVQSFRVEQRSFDQLYNHLVVPLDVTPVQQDLTPVHPYQPCTLSGTSRAHAGIIDHVLKLLVIEGKALAEFGLFDLFLPAFQRVNHGPTVGISRYHMPAYRLAMAHLDLSLVA